LLSYHYVFIVVSLAVLGLGTGGIFVHLFRRRELDSPAIFKSFGIFPSLFALSIPFSLLLTIFIASLQNSLGQIFWYCLLMFIPFFLVGIFLAELFRTFPTLSSRIYGMDLIGAAVGSIGVVHILNILGGINSSLLLALIAATAALITAIAIHGKQLRGVTISVPRKFTIVSFVVVVCLFGTNIIGSHLPDVPVGTNPDKQIYSPMHETSYQGEIIETRWSAFGRTDLIASSQEPGVMGVFIDGTAGSPMYQFNGDLNDPNPMVKDLQSGFTGYFPFFFLEEAEKDTALIIGPGGGRDILLAQMGGVKRIDAVEVNQEIIDIGREYSWYNGGIYTDFNNTNVIVDEGRNFLKRQEQNYDVIMLSIPVINTSRSPEGYALTENFLLTKNSINDYLEHLTDEGRLIIVVHDVFEIFRLLSISLASFEEKGISNESAMQRIYMIVTPEFPMFVMKKTPFETTDIQSRYDYIQKMQYTPSFLYMPGLTQDTGYLPSSEYSGLNAAIIAISRGEMNFSEFEQALRQNGLNVGSVTDNSPFFYNFQVGIPQPISLVLQLSIIIVLIVILVPPLYRRRKASQPLMHIGIKQVFHKDLLTFIVAFLMLGMGFMLAEISLIQRLVLFLGQPVLSLSVLLFSILAGVGIGSLYTGRFSRDRILKVVIISCLIIVAMLFIYTFSLPSIFNELLGLSLNIRLLSTVGMLVPLGFFMGFPFPSGLRLLREKKMENNIPWMWGINGTGSVLGSALAMLIAVSLGFREALLVSAGCYIIVFLMFRRLKLEKAYSK